MIDDERFNVPGGRMGQFNTEFRAAINKALGTRSTDDVVAELTRAGWQHQKVLLSSAERAPFRVEGGAEGWEDLAEALSPSGGDGDGKWGGED